MTDNNLVGTIPNEIVVLDSMRILELSDNPISGSLPTELGGLVGLDALLSIYNTRVSGTLPTELGNLHSLKRGINLFWNKLSGTIPSQLAGLTANECTLSSPIVPTNTFECPIPLGVTEKTGAHCNVACNLSPPATSSPNVDAGEHLFALKPNAAFESVMPPSSPSISYISPESNHSGGQPPSSPSIDIGSEDASLSNTEAAQMGSITTTLLLVLGGLVFCGCLYMRRRRSALAKQSKLPLLPAAPSRPVVDVDDHHMQSPRSNESSSEGGSTSLGALASLFQRRRLSRLYQVGEDSPRHASALRRTSMSSNDLPGVQAANTRARHHRANSPRTPRSEYVGDYDGPGARPSPSTSRSRTPSPDLERASQAHGHGHHVQFDPSNYPTMYASNSSDSENGTHSDHDESARDNEWPSVDNDDDRFSAISGMSSLSALRMQAHGASSYEGAGVSQHLMDLVEDHPKYTLAHDPAESAQGSVAGFSSAPSIKSSGKAPSVKSASSRAKSPSLGEDEDDSDEHEDDDEEEDDEEEEDQFDANAILPASKPVEERRTHRDGPPTSRFLGTPALLPAPGAVASKPSHCAALAWSKSPGIKASRAISRMSTGAAQASRSNKTSKHTTSTSATVQHL